MYDINNNHANKQTLHDVGSSYILEYLTEVKFWPVAFGYRCTPLHAYMIRYDTLRYDII